jgi:hypothetical protein
VPTGTFKKSICVLTAYFGLLLRSIPQHIISLPTYIPLRMLSPRKPLPLIGCLLLFGATQHTLLNPTTLTGGLLTLYYTQPGLHQYIDPTLLALTNFHSHDWTSTLDATHLPNPTPGTHRRLLLFVVILLLLITPVEAIPSLQDAEIISKAATLLSTFWLRSRAQVEDEPGEQPLPPLDTPTMLGNPTLPHIGTAYFAWQHSWWYYALRQMENGC